LKIKFNELEIGSFKSVFGKWRVGSKLFTKGVFEEIEEEVKEAEL